MSVADIIDTLGYPAVFLLVMGESLGLPLPGETALVVAAGASGVGTGLSVWWVILCAAGGAALGDTLGYWIGRKGGRPLLLKGVGPIRIRKKKLDRAEHFFEQHGAKTIFLARFIMFLRVVAAFVAGASRMHYRTFLFYNISGGIVWAMSIGLLAHFAGRQVGTMDQLLLWLSIVLLALTLIGGGGYWLLERARKHRQERRARLSLATGEAGQNAED